VPHYSVKLCTYDPAIIAAFARLRKNRKQAAFTHEALKNFLTTEKGGQMLLLMEGTTSTQLPALPIDPLYVSTPNKWRDVASNSAPNSSSVLDSILK